MNGMESTSIVLLGLARNYETERGMSRRQVNFRFWEARRGRRNLAGTDEILSFYIMSVRSTKKSFTRKMGC